MTDNLTGLMWLADANCIASRHPDFDTDGTPVNGGVAWGHAIDFPAGMNTGTDQECGAGHTDWCLPNANEPDCLVNAEKSNSALWLADQGFTNVPLIVGPRIPPPQSCPLQSILYVDPIRSSSLLFACLWDD